MLEWRTILSNVLFGLEIRGAKTPQNVARARELLKTYGLYEFRHKYPRQLSGGMRQRVALIRTLATGPDILLLDEAFSALDYQTRLNVTDDVYRILKREQVTTLMVTHDIPESISMGDKILGPFRAARAGKGDPVRGLRAGALAALVPVQPAVRPLLRPYMERAEYR